MMSRYPKNLMLLPAFCSMLFFASGCYCNNSPQTASATSEDEPVATVVAPKEIPTKRTPETVLAKVDDKEITQADLDKEIAKMSIMLKNSGISPDQMQAMMPEMESQIVIGLATKALIENECEKKSITVSDDEAKTEIDKIKADMPEGVSLDKMLAQYGMTEASFNEEIREQIQLKKLLEIKEPTDEQIEAYYKKNKELFDIPASVTVRHILIMARPQDEAKNEKKKTAEDIRRQLIEGADFDKLALEHSSCPSKQQGGSLGEISRGEMVPAFEEAAFNLKTDEISEVVETQYGYHIIQATAHHSAKTTPLDEVAPQIKSAIQAEEFQEKIGVKIESLKEKATITYNEGFGPDSKSDI